MLGYTYVAKIIIKTLKAEITPYGICKKIKSTLLPYFVQIKLNQESK